MNFVKNILLWTAALWCGAVLAAPPEQEGALLWRIGKDGKTLGHLAGTMHVGRAADPLPAQFQAALKQSGGLLLENGMPESEDEQLRARMRLFKLMTDPQRRPLMQTLGKARLAKANRLLQRYGEEKKPFQSEWPVAPWIVMNWVSLALLPEGYSSKHGTESKLTKQAKADNIPVDYLEGVETIEIFSKLPEATVISSLDLHLNHPRQAIAFKKKLAGIYHRQDTAALWRESLKDTLPHRLNATDRAAWKKFMREEILENRNRAWLPKITAKLENGRPMVAVGALHLFGDYGLIALLREQGYTLEPVK